MTELVFTVGSASGSLNRTLIGASIGTVVELFEIVALTTTGGTVSATDRIKSEALLLWFPTSSRARQESRSWSWGPAPGNTWNVNVCVTSFCAGLIVNV